MDWLAVCFIYLLIPRMNPIASIPATRSMVSLRNGARRSLAQSARAWIQCKAQNRKYSVKVYAQVVFSRSFTQAVYGSPWQRIELKCWVTGIPVSCSRAWMGPARQTLVLSRLEPSEPGTILCVCLRERPTRPFEEQHACRFGQRDSVEWTWLWMSERERERERRGERWVGRGFYKTGYLLSSKCWNRGLSQPVHDFFLFSDMDCNKFAANSTSLRIHFCHC